MKGRIRAVCISSKRGTAKKEVPSAVFVEDFGIREDAHGGKWHRQVSLLSAERIDEFNEKGAGVKNGDFGENLVIEGLDPREYPTGSILTIEGRGGPVRLRITQKGKECHSHCEIYKRMGECIMPVSGVFAEVISGGEAAKGDSVSIEYPDINRPFQAAVIVLSDKGAKGERDDLSGPKASSILKDNGYEVIESILIPDDRERLKNELIRLSDGREADLIITSGGTGFSPRDITPEATLEVADRNAPGIAEYMRFRSFEITDRAMLSRAASVIRGKTLIVNLPGSPRAVEECLGFIMNGLEHGLRIMRGSAAECARP
ncbi:MAG TPA: molybdenum cofactor biosynthesis protein [Lachnospiraceae bacterium]|nr:molybdenum cofactor biosynthesis protein [Lachnospiraceae bacterium]